MDMRPEPNNEIDLLLRQLGRQNGVSVSHNDEQHLDADELSSYVANALPAKARARYMQHLADCSSCRKTVAQLTAAEGPVAVQQPATVVEPSGLKSFLASLFSPLVLRYAVPALGVIVIAVVGIVMFRQDQLEKTGASVAQVSNTDQRPAATQDPAAGATPAARAPERTAQGFRQGPVAADTASAPPPPKPVPAEEARERQPEAETKSLPPAERSVAATDAVQPAEEAKAGQPVKKEASKEADTKENQQTEAVAAAPAAASVPGNKAPEPQRAKATATAGAGTATGGVANAAPSRAELRRAGKDDRNSSTFSSAETRTVSGRDFVKRGDVWIDVAYNSSQATTVVSRGTEQYRALVADEPAIHTIAENLKSEFVVVWKGRAYRIR